MPVTKAVASSVKTPGFYINVNLLGPASNPGTAILRALILAPKGSAGNIAVGTEVRQVFGATDAATALGAGTQGHLAAKRFFTRHPKGALDIVAPAESAGAAATGTQTFTGPATENTNIRFRVAGRLIDVAWLSGEAATAFVTRAVATINQYGDDLPVVASDAGSGSILYTAKTKGPWGNDVRLWVAINTGGTGVAITANPTNLTGGTTEPNFTTALDLVKTTEYARIIPCISNADAADTTSSSNAERLANHINAYETGNKARLQVGVVGNTGSTTNAKAGAIDRNNEAMQYALGRNWDDLPCELAAEIAGLTLEAISDRANANLIGEGLGLYGPRDLVGQKLTDAETEDLLNNGVTPLDVDPLTGALFLVEPITTHSVFNGAPDFRAYHMSDTDAMYDVVRDLRTAVPQEFKGASITDDIDGATEPLPRGVVELRDVKGFVIQRCRAKARAGIVNTRALEASIEAGELSVTIDEGDPAQVNIFLPLTIIKPLAKFGLVASKQG